MKLSARWFGLGVLVAALASCGGENTNEGIITHVEPGASLDSLNKLDLVLAWVGDQPVTAGDVKAHMLEASGPQNVEQYLQNPDILHVALNGLVDQFVWADLARRDGFTLTPGQERQVRAFEALRLSERYVADVVQERARAPREEIETYYQNHQERFIRPSRVAIRHIMVASQEEAAQLKGEVENGADFVVLVRAHSLDEGTRDLGGALGYVEKGKEILGIGRNAALEKEILVMEPGEMTILQSAHGWHLIRAEKKEGGDLAPLEDVYQDISDVLLRQRFPKYYEGELTVAREQTGVRYISENFEAFTGVTNNTSRLMKLAVDHPDPGGTVTLYRRVAFDFPEDPRAAEAQFMIAYTLYSGMSDPRGARKAITRLERMWPDTEWAKAGLWLKEHLLEKPETVGSVDEVLKKALSSDQ